MARMENLSAEETRGILAQAAERALQLKLVGAMQCYQRRLHQRGQAENMGLA